MIPSFFVRYFTLGSESTTLKILIRIHKKIYLNLLPGWLSKSFVTAAAFQTERYNFPLCVPGETAGAEIFCGPARRRAGESALGRGTQQIP